MCKHVHLLFNRSTLSLSLMTIGQCRYCYKHSAGVWWPADTTRPTYIIGIIDYDRLPSVLAVFICPRGDHWKTTVQIRHYDVNMVFWSASRRCLIGRYSGESPQWEGLSIGLFAPLCCLFSVWFKRRGPE